MALDIKSFIAAARCLPPEIAILSKGSTGVGKSFIFRQLAEELGLELYDRRLAQMTEGDIIGLPSLSDGVTRFLPVDWIKIASERPVALFLDELNRATPEVQQCAFQLVLDREINGIKLHKDTRVWCAVNEGSQYQVNDMDPALMRRFWSCELVPTVDDWLAWAKSAEIDSVIYEFIRTNPKHLNYTGEYRPGEVFPTPASWHRFDKTLKHAKIEPQKFLVSDEYAKKIEFLPDQQVPVGLFVLASGFVGSDAAITFTSYLNNYEMEIKAEDILNHFNSKKVQAILKEQKNDKHAANCDKILDWLDQNTISIPQVKNLRSYLQTVSGELLNHVFGAVFKQKNNKKNIELIHEYLQQDAVRNVLESQEAEKRAKKS